MKAHALHPDARKEYLDAATFYFGIQPELAGRFYDEIEALISDVRRRPETYPIYDPPVRRHFSQIFPYAILYRDEPDRVFVLAVMNMRRKPGYWKSRLER